MQFRQSIQEPAQPFRGGMLLPIPLFIGSRVAQAKIGREVDDLRSEACIPIDVMLSLSVRLSKKEDIDRLEPSRVAELYLCALAEIRMHLVHILTQMRTRCNLPYFDMWMAQQ